MKKLGILLSVVFLGGCASANTEYYEAVEAAALANAQAVTAKMEALSAIAAAGDGQAASAAVMALALTQAPTIAPVPQQSQAIQWAGILAAPLTSLGMAWMQSDASKAMAKYNADVSLARVSATSQSNAALYGAFTDMNATTASVAGNADYGPFIEGMVDLGLAGINGAVDLGTAGFDSNTQIAGSAIDGLVDLGGQGLDSAVTLGTAGLTSATTLGTAGLTSLTDVSLAGYQNILDMDAANNSLFSSVWTDYQSAIQTILDAQVNCTATTAADGSVTISCQ